MEFSKNDFIVVYPGQYLEKEKEPLENYLKECDKINSRGPLDIEALVQGRLPEGTPGIGPVVPVTEAMVRYNHAKYEQENPLFNDAAYARSRGFQDIPAYFTFGAHDDTFTTPYIPEVRDTLLVSQISHRVDQLAPVYPGDTLYLVFDKRTITDITPPEGSIHRTMALHQEGSIYNQKGVKVNEVVFNCTESVRFFKDGKRPEEMDFSKIWEAPEWTSKPDHCYTQKDYDWMKEIWSKETVRGADTLYWEAVTPGDEPALTLESPVIDSVLPTAPYGMGIGGTRSLKKEIMDEAVFGTMVKRDQHGIYVLPDKKDYTPAVPDNAQVVMIFDDGRRTDEEKEAEGAVDTADIHSAGGADRAPIINFFGRDVAIHHINNWMGDEGVIRSIGWSIMPAATHAAYGKPVPVNPHFVDYLKQAPGMKDRAVNVHGLTRDIALVNSVVTDKYVRNGQYLVKLIWWIEDIEGGIFIAGSAEVELKHREQA